MIASELKAEIDARTARLAQQLDQLVVLKRQHDDAVSREWVAANNVTAAQVQRSDGDALPWFGDVMTFGRWMNETSCTRPWAEWNGRIYSSAELMQGRMMRNAPGCAEHALP